MSIRPKSRPDGHHASRDPIDDALDEDGIDERRQLLALGPPEGPSSGQADWGGWDLRRISRSWRRRSSCGGSAGMA